MPDQSELVIDFDRDFSTDNISLAAFLRSLGYFYKMDINGDTCRWYFDDGQVLRAAVERFSRGEARVNPARYAKWLSRLKVDMWSRLDGGAA